MQNDPTANRPIISDAKFNFSSHLPLRTIAAYLFVFLFIYSFFSGLTYKFYASFLFLFYSWVGKMWLAVVCIGLFQVLLMIPFRIINLKISHHIREFKDRTSQLNNSEAQSFLVKRNIKKGNRPLLFYTVDFVVQLTLYLSIGRLFLTDFYNTPLNPHLLFSFAPYPKYPIQDTIFKIPYPGFIKTVDLGIGSVLVFWTLIVLLQFLVYIYKTARRRSRMSATLNQNHPILPSQIKKYISLVSGNTILLFVLSWILLRHFPVNWHIRIFSGDISVPNRNFNTLTALVTFGTLIWFGTSNIARKTKIAIAERISSETIFQTQKAMFKDTFKSATLVGLGAYFITNHIPCAFELSIFTFELIALLSPLTLDKLITSAA